MKFLSSFSFENIEKLECNNIHFFQYFILLFYYSDIFTCP